MAASSSVASRAAAAADVRLSSSFRGMSLSARPAASTSVAAPMRAQTRRTGRLEVQVRNRLLEHPIYAASGPLDIAREVGQREGGAAATSRGRSESLISTGARYSYTQSGSQAWRNSMPSLRAHLAIYIHAALSQWGQRMEGKTLQWRTLSVCDSVACIVALVLSRRPGKMGGTPPSSGGACGRKIGQCGCRRGVC